MVPSAQIAAGKWDSPAPSSESGGGHRPQPVVTRCAVDFSRARIPEALAMPGDDGLWLHDDECGSPIAPRVTATPRTTGLPSPGAVVGAATAAGPVVDPRRRQLQQRQCVRSFQKAQLSASEIMMSP